MNYLYTIHYSTSRNTPVYFYSKYNLFCLGLFVLYLIYDVFSIFVFANFDIQHFSEIYILSGLRPATLLKKRFWHRCFPVNFAKFLRTPFLTEYFRWLLPVIEKKQITRDVWISNYMTWNISNSNEMLHKQ